MRLSSYKLQILYLKHINYKDIYTIVIIKYTWVFDEATLIHNISHLVLEEQHHIEWQKVKRFYQKPFSFLTSNHKHFSFFSFQFIQAMNKGVFHHFAKQGL